MFLQGEILQKRREKGGLKLVDLSIKDSAIKISWIPILHEDQGISNIAYAHLSPTLKEAIWLVNLKSQDVQHMQINSIFWKDVLKAWCSINYSERLQMWHPIWLNSLIRVDGKPVMYENIAKNGLLEVSQMWKDGKPILLW